MLLVFNSATQGKIYINPWYVVSVEFDPVDNMTCITALGTRYYVTESLKIVADVIAETLEDLQ